ncbi:MAG TPA: tetratricopeptide repeat protein [Geobacteraceae bacterium]|nr:tetratricopeptide repeat protein [Geobacteraceae bacterium]
MVTILLLVVITGALYWQTLGYDFLRNWDDNHYILENADIQGFGWDRIRAVFTKYYVGNYAPVHLLSYMVDYALWGLHPGGYHLTNLLLHTANGLLLYRLFHRLTANRLAAWSGAALFLLHPVQVESVVWISQRKNLLAMFFFLLAWAWYLAYRDTESGRRRFFYAASLTALLLALLAKSVAVIFPVAMLLFDHCYGDDRVKQRVRDKMPYLLVSGLAAVLAIFSQTPDPLTGRTGGLTAYHGGSPIATFLTMLPVFCSYLRLIVWPDNLSALYDPVIHRSVDVAVLPAAALLAGIGYLVYRLYRAERRIAFWPLFSFLALLPVSQIVPLVTLMNDRYLYFPMIGVAALVAYGVNRLAAVRGMNLPGLTACVAALLLVLGMVSLGRIQVWRNGVALWSDTVRKSPNLPLAWEALGEAYHYNPRPNREEAKKAYLKVIALNPDVDISRYNLGILYLDQNDLANADRVLSELLRRSPKHVMGMTAFGDLALRRADYATAERYYREALVVQPDAVEVQRKLANLMVGLGRMGEARAVLLQIETLEGGTDPGNAYELARVEALAGDVGASIGWLEKALQRGYGNYSGIMADEELTLITSDARFADLVSRYFPRR